MLKCSMKLAEENYMNKIVIYPVDTNIIEFMYSVYFDVSNNNGTWQEILALDYLLHLVLHQEVILEVYNGHI